MPLNGQGLREQGREGAYPSFIKGVKLPGTACSKGKVNENKNKLYSFKGAAHWYNPLDLHSKVFGSPAIFE